MDEQGFLTDFKKIQEISGFAAASGVLMTLVAVFLIPISHQAKINILSVAVATFVFILIYYLIPGLYLNKKLAFLPDMVYVLAITLVMLNMGEYGYVYFIFYMILAAVDAFIFPLYQYAIVVLTIVVSIFVVNLGSDMVFSSNLIYQVYGVLVLAVALHLIAREALKEKSDRCQYEESIKELEGDKREIRALLAAISDGMFVVNAENKITFCNPAAPGLLGMMITEDKILGRDINDFMPTVGSEGPEPLTRKVFGTLEQSIRNDFRIVKPEKTIRLHTNISPVVGEKGTLEGAIIFFRDITNEKRIEEQRAEFNAVASHELRTPLSVIEGYLYYVLDPTSKLKYSKETKEYIEKAHEASQELNSLVTDILTIVKAEEGGLEVSLEEIVPDKFFKEIVTSFQDKAKEKGIELEYKVVTSRKIPKITTDIIKTKEVASNLINNAIKFTEKGKVEVELGQMKNELIISVSDTGVGIEKSDLGNVYHKFFRAENYKVRKTSGSGLGLYIVKTLVERLGGRVGAQSVMGRGSKFYFTLPIEYSREEESVEKKGTGG